MVENTFKQAKQIHKTISNITQALNQLSRKKPCRLIIDTKHSIELGDDDIEFLINALQTYRDSKQTEFDKL